MRRRAFGGRRRASGFTIVELLISILGVTTALAALMISTTAGQRLYQTSEASLAVQQRARQALTAMTRELRDSGNVSCPTTAQVDFQVTHGYDGSSVTWGDGQTPNQWAHYLRSGTQLLRCTTVNRDDAPNFATCRILANGATAFTVNFDITTRLVNVQLGLQEAIRPGSSAMVTSSLRSLVYLRNP